MFERLCNVNPEKRGVIEDWIKFDLNSSFDISDEDIEENDGEHLSAKMVNFKLYLIIFDIIISKILLVFKY